jgi:hypothetical protein
LKISAEGSQAEFLASPGEGNQMHRHPTFPARKMLARWEADRCFVHGYVGEKMRLWRLPSRGKNAMQHDRNRRKNFSLLALKVICIENNFISLKSGV